MTRPTEPGVSIFPILTVNFVGTLGFSIVLPFLIFLVTRWGGNALIYGLLGATYSVFQLVGAPILGRWSDSYGRRKILLLSQLGTLASWGLFLVAFLLPVEVVLEIGSGGLGGFALTLPLLVVFLARAADGLTGGNVSVANAYLADITAEDDRSANFGKMAVAANLGFILGPALAGLLGATVLGELLPVFAAFLISALASLLIAFRLRESRPCTLTADPEATNVRRVFGQEQKECFRIQCDGKPSLRQILALPDMPRILAIYFLVMLGFNVFYVSFPVHAVRTLEWSVTQTGVFFSVMAVSMALVQGPALGWLSKRCPDGVLLVAGGLILSLSFVFFLSASALTIHLGAICLALGNGLMWPSMLAVLSKAAGERYQGSAQGIASSLGACASIAGLIAGGLLYDSLGGTIFAIACITILVASAVSLPLRGSRR